MENIDNKYQIKDEITHILDRAGMFIGSTINVLKTSTIYFPSKNILKEVDNVPCNDGLHKIIDEVFSNSIDEYRRSKLVKKQSLFDITNISLSVNEDGVCEIRDNGGIPVVKHSKTNLYVPKMIFGMLRTSSNYDDEIEKEWVGTNGFGAKLTNIFSEWFQVETCDGKTKYVCRWKDNMRISEPEQITSCKPGEHYTHIMFKIELKRFDLEKIDVGNLRLLQKYSIDAAASNPGLNIHFQSDIFEGKLNSDWKFGSFIDYIKLYIDEKNLPNIKNKLLQFTIGRDTLILGIGLPIENVGFVNGILCNQGTHIKRIQKQIAEYMVNICHENEMILITEKDVISRITIFVNCTITNPAYDSQSKTCLATKIDSSKLKLDEKILSEIKKSELYLILKDYYNIKYKEETKKELRQLNNSIKSTKSKKLIQPGIKDSRKNELWIFEGNSASGGFRKMRNSYQAAYLLRGKIKNTLNLSRSQIIENQELREIISALGLQFEKPNENLRNISYSKIVFCTDMDSDGDHICGLLLSFFAKHFPELFTKNIIYRALSPIIIAQKGKKISYYYNMKDWENDMNNHRNDDIQYTKGLGGLSDINYREMLQNPKFLKLTFKDSDKESIKIWFDKSTTMRKELLMAENENENNFENS